jgi:aspartate 1-decarboxylase
VRACFQVNDWETSWGIGMMGCCGYGKVALVRRSPSEQPFMQVHLLKSKIHRAQVTDSSLDYEGSLTIALDLMEKAGLLPYERVLCSNLANGERFETYVIPGERGSGAIVLNGATAHLGKVGDRLTIMSYTFIDEALAKKWEPRVLVLGGKNVIKQQRGN